MRFTKSYLELLYRYLQIPEKIVCVQGSMCNEMEALCILLKKLAYPCRYSDTAARFGKKYKYTLSDLQYSPQSHLSVLSPSPQIPMQLP